MAILKWPSDTFTINISNKSVNNTGISKIFAYIQKPDSNNYYFNGNIDNISNKNAQNTDESTTSFTLFSNVESYFSGSSQSVDLELYSTIYWGDGGVTDPIKVSGFTLCNPATYIYIYPSSTSIWNTGEIFLNKCYFGTAYGIPYNYNSKKITLHVGTDLNNVQLKSYININSTLHGSNLGKISKGAFWDENGVCLGKVFAYANGGAPTSGAVSPTKLTASYPITIKNAVNKIVLNDTETNPTIYIAKGNTTTVNYTVEPYDTNGYAYNKIYTVSKQTSENSSIATATINSYTIGSNKIATGTISIKGIAVGTTSLSIQHTNASGSIISEFLSIYVSSASDEITLNGGDTYLWEIASSTGLILNPSKNAEFTAIFTTVNGKPYVQVTANANATSSTGTLELKDPAGNVISTLTINTVNSNPYPDYLNVTYVGNDEISLTGKITIDDDRISFNATNAYIETLSDNTYRLIFNSNSYYLTATTTENEISLTGQMTIDDDSISFNAANVSFETLSDNTYHLILNTSSNYLGVTTTENEISLTGQMTIDDESISFNSTNASVETLNDNTYQLILT